jgi:4-hydroxy-tetrahydrodipicolinate synthase
MSTDSLFGISAALATPFRNDGSIDLARLTRHTARLLKEGCTSVTLFGTTAEGPGISMEERRRVIEAMSAAGISGDKLVIGVITSSLGDAVAEARRGIAAGCKALLVAPPFYFKGLTDDGLFAWYSTFIATLGADCPPIILYHIPQVTAAPLSVPLIRRLKDAFPREVFGVKDSSGDWENSRQLLEFDDLAILIGDERLLARAAPLGGQGAISGVANFQAAALAEVLASGQANARLDAVVSEIVSHPVIPAIKVALAAYLKDPEWARVRSPLLPLESRAAKAVADAANDLFLKALL